MRSNKNLSSHIDTIVIGLMKKFNTTSAQRTSIRDRLELLPMEKRTFAEAYRMAYEMGIPEQYDEAL